eukprot:Seg2473.7 transcript_id=Seg2473.7/GoldUCD/mRNA.D3Y31 product="hypothetical protein" protein_id=Seg2473.7/GoldUCD/D3Y31
MHCWTDSQVVLWWILGDTKVQKQFVQNRLVKIRSLVSKENWGYCNTTSNPADLASRGIACSKLVTNSLWWDGPAFLTEQPENWPTFGNTNLTEIDNEVSEIENVSAVLVNTNTPSQNIGQIIHCESYSSYDKLIRITALVLKFIKRLKRQVLPENLETLISPEDLAQA